MTLIAPSPSAATLESGIPLNPGTRPFSPQWHVGSLCLGQKGPPGTSQHSRISHGRWPGPPRSQGRSWLLCGGVSAPVVLAGSSQFSGASPEGQVGCGHLLCCWPWELWQPTCLDFHLGGPVPPTTPAPCHRPVTACFWLGACPTPCPGAVPSMPSPSLAQQVLGPASPASTPNPEPQAHHDGGRPGALLPRQAPRHSCASCLQALCPSEPRSPCHESGEQLPWPRGCFQPLSALCRRLGAVLLMSHYQVGSDL